MDFFPSYETFSFWLEHYGSISLFLMLAAGIIALPVPEESLMILAGVFIQKGILDLPQTALASFAGSVTGITISYFLGRTVGHYLLKKLGWLIKEKRWNQVQQWFNKFGKWTLFIGYFIPGVRHFTGLATGMTGVGFKQFALFAYSGALTWVSTFLSIGYLFGGYGLSYFENIEIGIESVGILLLLGIVIGILYLIKNKSSTTATPADL
jgi:membrane protein DedA with SNARE-associated domain